MNDLLNILPIEYSYGIIALFIYGWGDSIFLSRWYGNSLPRRIFTIFAELAITIVAMIVGNTKYPDSAEIIVGVGLFEIFWIVVGPVLEIMYQCFKLLMQKLWSYTHIIGYDLVSDPKKIGVMYLIIKKDK